MKRPARIVTGPIAQTFGDELEVDAPADAMVLVVETPAVFDETGGSLVFLDEANGQHVVGYDGVDDDTGEVFLTDPLPVPLFTPTRVELWDETAGAPITEYVADVVFEDQDDGDVLPAVVHASLVDRLVSEVRGVVGTAVTVERDQDDVADGELYITEIDGQQARLSLEHVDVDTAPDGLGGDAGPTETPGASPPLNMRGAVGALAVALGETSSGTEAVDVWISTASPVSRVGAPTFTTAGLTGDVTFVRAVAGQPVASGTAYYAVALARNGLGPAAAGPSPEVSATPAQVNTADIVTESVTSDLILANAVTAAKIATNQIIARHILAGEIQAQHIKSDAIDGKVITGATIQTGSSGARIRLLSAGLIAYDSANSEVTSISTATGRLTARGATITGEVTAGSGSDEVKLWTPSGSPRVEFTRSGAQAAFIVANPTVGLRLYSVYDFNVYVGDSLSDTGFTLNAQGRPIFPRHNTATGTASASLQVGGQLVRNTSRRDAKLDIEPIGRARVRRFFEVPLVSWFDRVAVEAHANELATGVPDDGNGMLLTRVPGLIAEDVEAAGLREFVTYDAAGRIEGLAYDRIGVAWIPLLREAHQRIATLEQRAGITA